MADALSTKQRAILEFFIANLRVRSQKTHRLWKTLNQLFDSTLAARNNTISNQYTVNMAFDNWQQMITKKWQTNGCSERADIHSG